MGNHIGKRPTYLSRHGVVVLREENLEPLIGTVSHVSKDDFKMIIHSTLKFNEKIRVVFNADTKQEYQAAATVRTLKPIIGSSLRVHGVFSGPLPDGVYLNLTKEGHFERRTELRTPCDLMANISIAGDSKKTPATVVDFSDSGYCFHTHEPFQEGAKIVVELNDEQDRSMCVSATVCSVSSTENGFRVGCSVQRRVHSHSENRVPRAKGWFHRIKRMVFNPENVAAK